MQGIQELPRWYYHLDSDELRVLYAAAPPLPERRRLRCLGFRPFGKPTAALVWSAPASPRRAQALEAM